MSVPPLSRIVRFLLIAAGLIIVLSVVWSFIDSTYSNFLSWIARSVVSEGVTVQEKAGSIYFIHSIRYMGGSLQVEDWIDAAAIQFGLLLTVALMAATPGLTLKRRGAFTGIAVAVTFVLQVLSVIVMAKTYNSLFFVIVSDVFPLVLWAVFSLRYLLAPSRPRPAESAPVSHKNAR
jgi:hypothetical protein